MKRIMCLIGTLASINGVFGSSNTYNQSVVQSSQPTIRKYVSRNNETSEMMIPSEITFFCDRPYVRVKQTWEELCNEFNQSFQKELEDCVCHVAKDWIANEFRNNRRVNPIVGIFRRKISNFKIYVVGEVVREDPEKDEEEIIARIYNYFPGFSPENNDGSGDRDIGVLF